MAIIITANKWDFTREFEAIRPGNFSREGLSLLFEYLDNLSDDMGKDIELDPIAICCDYSEYSLEDWWYEYNDPTELMGMDEDGVHNHMLECAEKAANDGLIIAHNDDYSVVIVDSNY